MMRSTISLLACLFVVINCWAYDSTSVQVDSSNVEIRNFDQEKINEHQADDEFDYGNRAEAELSLWERIKRWFMKLIQNLFYLGTNTPVGKIIIYLLCIAVAIYAIIKILKLKSRRLFHSDPQDTLGYDLHHENIHEMNFDELIEQAINEKNYRLAIRLIYLYALKHLSDRHLIDWQPGKTNHDYVNELSDNNLKPGFDALSYYFDYTWYGHFEVSFKLFNKVSSTFDQWKGSLKP
ncbi:MAG: DUF4129 domain-containing protein [Fulvivirga sp.]|nr:DUF4129 domain-containing protein [Fulvivirga sp.]